MFAILPPRKQYNRIRKSSAALELCFLVSVSKSNLGIIVDSRIDKSGLAVTGSLHLSRQSKNPSLASLVGYGHFSLDCSKDQNVQSSSGPSMLTA